MEETLALLLAGLLTPDSVAAKAIGYRQTIELLHKTKTAGSGGGEGEDKVSFEQYLADFCTATRNYAKRQLHWYVHIYVHVYV